MRKNNPKRTNVLPIEDAKQIALSAQGLNKKFAFGRGSEGALNSILHLGYVQLDTLAVIARAHHHTLWSRSADYSESTLQALLANKQVFEYWSHAAAFLPMQDFRFSLYRKNEFLSGKSHWFKKNKKIMTFVLDRILAEGPLRAKDFETDRKRGSWFDWKPAKVALEQLFHEGTLMVSERKGFQKVYDLANRVIPVGTNTQAPSNDEYADHLIRSAVRAHGIAGVKDITHLRKGMVSTVNKRLNALLDESELTTVTVEGIDEVFYAEPTTLNQKPISTNELHILSPFDNAVIRRERLQKVFGYDYAIECYLPEHKRKFGYFCLPVLYNGNFVGRFDPKADRQSKTLLIKQFHLEHPPQDLAGFIDAFATALKTFATFNGCERVVLEATRPAKIKMALKGRISKSPS